MFGQVLRKPKEFLIALLEKFGQLTQSTSPDVRSLLDTGCYDIENCAITHTHTHTHTGGGPRDCDHSLRLSLHCTAIVG